MRLAGRVFRIGRQWAVEVPLLDVVSQGFRVDVFPGAGEHFEVGSTDQAALTALLLRRARQRSGLSLSQVARRLGSSSVNAYARYEQGRAVPSVEKLSELFGAVSADRDLVLVESEA